MHKIEYIPTQIEVEDAKAKLGRARANIVEYVTEASNAYRKLHWWQIFSSKVIHQMGYAKYLVEKVKDIEFALDNPRTYQLDIEDIEFIDYWYEKNGERILNI